MVQVTYLAAYHFRWQAPRFSGSQGGNAAPDIGALRGLVTIPLRNLIFWVIFASLVGMIIGSITVFLKKKLNRAAV